MSGRSGYRKTDRKKNRSLRLPRPRNEYVLRFQLPKLLAAFLTPGLFGYGVTIGFNDIVFVSGQTPAHCCQLAADFLNQIGARDCPQQTLSASIIKLLPCPAHHLPTTRAEGFRPIGIDLEAVHDRISRNQDRARKASIAIGATEIGFTGAVGKRLVHDYADECASHRKRA